MRNHKADLLRFARANRIDLSLAGVGALFLAVFTYRAANSSRYDSLETPVARLISGTAEKKKPGGLDGAEAAPGETFFDLDAAWIPSEEARFKIEDGSVAVLKPKTYVVFRRPFTSGSYRIEDLLEVVSGEVQVEQRNLKAPIEEDETPGESPSGKKSQPIPPPDGMQAVYPPENSLFYYRPSAMAEIPFSLSKQSAKRVSLPPNSTFLLREDGPAGKKRFLPIELDTLPQLNLPLGRSYTWQVIDREKKSIYGPYHFEAQSLAVGQEAILLQSTASNRPVFTFW